MCIRDRETTEAPAEEVAAEVKEEAPATEEAPVAEAKEEEAPAEEEKKED